LRFEMRARKIAAIVGIALVFVLLWLVPFGIWR